MPGTTPPPPVWGDWLAPGRGVQGMRWVTSPACTELETHVMDWLVEMLALPPRFKSTSSGGGVIQDTASSSTPWPLLAARRGRPAEAMAAARAAGLQPAFVCATIGTTSSTAIDPVAAVGRVCREQGGWVHVGAAMAGAG